MRTFSRSIYRPKQPKSFGTLGEIAMHRLLTDFSKSTPIQFQSGMMEGGGVKIQTKFREWPFSVDFLITHGPNGLLRKQIIVEVQGGLHFKTWKGRPATRRMKKDEVKRNCLEAEGYILLTPTDKEARFNPTKFLEDLKRALA
jgi:very-short-patch-repair endonuclease